MFRVNNFQAFFRALVPWLKRRNEAGGANSTGVTDASEVVSFRFRADGLVLGTRSAWRITGSSRAGN